MTLNNIFTLENISFAIKQLKAENIDTKEIQKEVLEGDYIPFANEKIEMKLGEKIRPITLASTKDKIIQRTLLNGLKEFDKCLSNKSYAYRPNKSPLKAINRTTDYLKRGYKFVFKSDIKNFFETINHDILSKILSKYIQDKKLLTLLILFFKNGYIHKFDYSSHNVGVYQGDIISPFLSNIYLDVMDKFLERQGFEFVRFADDFVVFANTQKELNKIEYKLTKILNLLKLSLNKEKTFITHKKRGFSFLGIIFKDKERKIENDRFQKIISNISKAKKTSLKEFVNYLNSYYSMLENYHIKFMSDTQKTRFIDHIIDSLAWNISNSKKQKEIKTKQEFKNILKNLKFTDEIEKIIHLGYEKYYLQTSTKVDKLLNKQKIQTSKKLALMSTIHIQKFGVFIGISKYKIVIKEKNQISKTYPISQIKRIVINSPAVTISSKLFYVCAKNEISIDFIDYKNNPYGSFINYNSTTTQIIHKQALILNNKNKHFAIAKQIVKGKIKNQLNYIKYLKKYHKNLSENVAKMEEIYNKFKFNTNFSALMGYEGSMAVIYWDSIGKVLEIDEFRRITKGANDLVNSALNYGYAILYGKVQSSLIKAGISLHISFLHSLDKQKPTLVFDMIEEFRSFVVDRVIIAMINKNEPLKMDKNLLSEKSKKLIAKNIYEKLGSYTTWKKQSVKIENIIQIQAYNLVKFIQEDKTYKPFIGKY